MALFRIPGGGIGTFWNTGGGIGTFGIPGGGTWYFGCEYNSPLYDETTLVTYNVTSPHLTMKRELLCKALVLHNLKITKLYIHYIVIFKNIFNTCFYVDENRCSKNRDSEKRNNNK